MELLKVLLAFVPSAFLVFSGMYLPRTAARSRLCQQISKRGGGNAARTSIRKVICNSVQQHIEVQAIVVLSAQDVCRLRVRLAVTPAGIWFGEASRSVLAVDAVGPARQWVLAGRQAQDLDLHAPVQRKA